MTLPTNRGDPIKKRGTQLNNTQNKLNARHKAYGMAVHCFPRHKL